MVYITSLRFIGAILLLATTSVVLAYGHDDHAGEMAKMGPAPSSIPAASMNSSSTSQQSYFTYPTLGGLILGTLLFLLNISLS